MIGYIRERGKELFTNYSKQKEDEHDRDHRKWETKISESSSFSNPIFKVIRRRVRMAETPGGRRGARPVAEGINLDPIPLHPFREIK